MGWKPLTLMPEKVIKSTWDRVSRLKKKKTKSIDWKREEGEAWDLNLKVIYTRQVSCVLLWAELLHIYNCLIIYNKVTWSAWQCGWEEKLSHSWNSSDQWNWKRAESDGSSAGKALHFFCQWVNYIKDDLWNLQKNKTTQKGHHKILLQYFIMCLCKEKTNNRIKAYKDG